MMKMNLTRTFGAMASTPVIKFKMNIQYNDSLNDLINWNTHPRWREIASEQYSSCRWESAVQQTLHNLWRTITRCQKHSSRRSISIQIYGVQFCSDMCYIQDLRLLSIWKKRKLNWNTNMSGNGPRKKAPAIMPAMVRDETNVGFHEFWQTKRNWTDINYSK